MMPWMTRNQRSLTSQTCEGQKVFKKKKKKRKHGNVNTLAIWHETRAPKARVHQSLGPTLQYLYPCTRHIVAPKCSQQSWKCCMSLWSSVATGGKLWHMNPVKLFFYCLKQSWHSRSVEMNKCVWKTNSHHIQPQDPWHLWCTAATNVNAFSLLFVQEPNGCWVWCGCKPE